MQTVTHMEHSKMGAALHGLSQHLQQYTTCNISVDEFFMYTVRTRLTCACLPQEDFWQLGAATL